MDVPQMSASAPVLVPLAPSPSKRPLILLVLLLILAAGVGGVVLEKYLSASKTLTAPTATPTTIPTATPTIDPTADWKTYIDEVGGEFSFKYPPTWFNQPRQTGPNGGLVEGKYFYSEDISHRTRQGNNFITLGIQKGRWYENQSLDRATKVFKSPIGVISSSSLEELIKIADMTISGYPGVHFTDEHGGGQEPPGFENIYVIKVDNSIYSLNFSSTDKQLVMENSKVFDQILSTFKFLDKEPAKCLPVEQPCNPLSCGYEPSRCK